jgi:uncharacterized protein (DUF58 family)
VRDDGFETAVSVVASVATALTASGSGVRLVTLRGEQIAAVAPGRWSSANDLSRLLDRLATVEPTDGSLDGRSGPNAPVRPGSAIAGSRDQLIAVLGRWQPGDAALLPSSSAGPGLALLVGSVAGGTGGLDSAPSLAGWRTVDVPDLASLPLVWQQTGAGMDAVAHRGPR